MKPRTKLAESQTPDGSRMMLYEQDGDFAMSLGGQELMHSRACASELLLGEVGIAKLRNTESPTILLGGLGLGFTLKTILEGLKSTARIEVIELLPTVVDWYREFLTELNGPLLEDPRVTVHVDDVRRVIRKANPNTYDAVILDVDNGPRGMVSESNQSLYSRKGMRAARSAIKPGGRIAIWSAGEDEYFRERMERAEFRVRTVPAKTHEKAKRAAYRIFVGDRA